MNMPLPLKDVHPGLAPSWWPPAPGWWMVAAVLALVEKAIKACLAQGKYIGICGQGPSDHPDLAEWLMQEGIESVSLNPDTVVDTWLRLAKSKAG